MLQMSDRDHISNPTAQDILARPVDEVHEHHCHDVEVRRLAEATFKALIEAPQGMKLMSGCREGADILRARLLELALDADMLQAVQTSDTWMLALTNGAIVEVTHSGNS